VPVLIVPESFNMLGLRSVEKKEKKSTVPNYVYNYITSGGPSSIMCMGRERWTVGTVGGWEGTSVRRRALASWSAHEIKAGRKVLARTK
jgi:hypothetical protein